MTACIRTVLFDLDGCLYPIANGVEERVRQNLFRWMVSELGVADVTLAEELWRVAFRRFNQGMRGLKAAGYRFDEDAYWRACRDGSTALLSPAPGVVALLERLRARGTRCWVLTNCREREALEVLAALGVDAALFDGVLGADFLGGVCKPEAAAFERVVAHTGCDPASTLFFEDSLKNLVASKALGMRTVLVGRATAEEEQGAAAGQEAVEEVDACVPELTLAAVLSSSAAALLFDE